MSMGAATAGLGCYQPHNQTPSAATHAATGSGCLPANWSFTLKLVSFSSSPNIFRIWGTRRLPRRARCSVRGRMAGQEVRNRRRTQGVQRISSYRSRRLPHGSQVTRALTGQSASRLVSVRRCKSRHSSSCPAPVDRPPAASHYRPFARPSLGRPSQYTWVYFDGPRHTKGEQR
jgi:hypothetical protein